MSITEEQYKWLAEQSYWVEKVRDDVDYHPEKGKKYFSTGKIIGLVNSKSSKLKTTQIMACRPWR
ncbi:hypothetical protein ACVRZS_06110 [Streptococcus ferus]|uniref:Uncharacterized protein n=1 Tax=Streptococcus ferus TaxID=1345 RepID=A0A2X3W6G8_9STRE|nr:hypothetical protein [Streptococcus ferus]SQF41117.1 Uncharacterised protein [Streptococcus ferus]